MSKTVLFMASTALAVLVVCGVALAADIQCPNRAGNLCVGTTGDDTLLGTANSDTIEGRDGGDLIKGLGAKDQLAGEPGNDEIRGGGAADDIFGGRGNETTFDSGGTPQPGIIGGLGPDGQDVHAVDSPALVVGARALLEFAVEHVVGARAVLRGHAVDVWGDLLDIPTAGAVELEGPEFAGVAPTATRWVR